MSEYCNMLREADENPKARDFIIKAANGNQEAFGFLWRLWCFEHCFDDLVDGDKEVDGRIAYRELGNFVTEIMSNEFVAANRKCLIGAIMVAICNQIRAFDEADAGMRDKLEHSDTQIYLQVALLTGGWQLVEQLRKELK